MFFSRWNQKVKSWCWYCCWIWKWFACFQCFSCDSHIASSSWARKAAYCNVSITLWSLRELYCLCRATLFHIHHYLLHEPWPTFATAISGHVILLTYALSIVPVQPPQFKGSGERANMTAIQPACPLFTHAETCQIWSWFIRPQYRFLLCDGPFSMPLECREIDSTLRHG